MAMERVSVEGVEGREEIAVRVVGDGPPVLLVHGIPGSSGSWGEVVPGLVEAGHQVLVPDLLGFGASSRPRTVEGLWLGAQSRALELGKPVVVLWGDSDPFFSLEEGRRAASAIPEAELSVAEGAGHFLPAERPDLFLEAVARLSYATREAG